MSTQLGGMHMQAAPDQKLVAALRTYVTSSEAAIAQVQADTAAHKSVNVITSDITGVAAAATAFSNAQDAWVTESYSTLQNFDPSDELKPFISALSELSTKVKQ